MKSFSVSALFNPATVLKVLLLVFCFLFFLTATAEAKEVKRGVQASAIQLEWTIVGGSGKCDGTTNYSNLGDGVVTNWVKNHTQAQSPLTLVSAGGSILEAPGTYTFTCTDADSLASDSDTLIVTDCLATEYWNGSACAANPVITFNSNGGTGSMANQTLPYNTATPINSNSFTRSGYTFDGWATSAGGSVAYANNANITRTADITLYAKWSSSASPIAGSCGSADGGSYSTAPSSNLCSVGATNWTDSTASDGTYNWQCLGSNGGVTDSCSATKSATPVNGVCSATAETCTAGTYVNSPADTSTDYRWTCNGQNGGSNSPTCTAAISGAPTVINPTVTDVSSGGATLGANVSSDGGSPVTDRGTCWGVSATPDTNCSSSGSGIGVFTHSRSGMACNTAYYMRGYATNMYGNGWSASQAFTTAPCAGPSASFTLTTCTIPSGGSNCSANIVWTSSGGVFSASVEENGSEFSTSVISNNPNYRTLSYGTHTYRFKNTTSGLATYLATDSIVVDCAAGSSWDGSKCNGGSCSDQLVTWTDFSGNGLWCSADTTLNGDGTETELWAQEADRIGYATFKCNGPSDSYTKIGSGHCSLAGADFRVDSLSINDATPQLREGFSYRFVATTTNVGTQSTDWIEPDYQLRYCWGESCSFPLSNLHIPANYMFMEVGESLKQVTNPIDFTQTGRLRVEFCIDTTNKFNESNEDDNCLISEYDIAPAGGVGIVCPVTPTLYVDNLVNYKLWWWGDESVTPSCKVPVVPGVVDKTLAANWSSSEPTVLQVRNVAGSKGWATALDDGVAVVSAAWGGKTYQQTVNVENGTPNLRPYGGISITNGFMVKDSNVTFGSQIENNGTAEAENTEASFKYCWGSGCTPVSQLANRDGWSYDIWVGMHTALIESVSLDLNQSGTLRVEFCADPLDEIAKLDESDNCVIAEYDVIDPGFGPWATFNPINDCEIPEGDSTCWTDVSWTSGGINNVTHRVEVEQNNAWFSNSGTVSGQSRNLNFGPNTFTFDVYKIADPSDRDELASAEATASCVTGAGWNVLTGKCQLVPTPGVCGVANRVYDFDETTYEYPLCNQGNPFPGAPAFPAVGDTGTWQCQGLNGGADANCSASRSDPPDPDLTIVVCDIAEDEADCLTVPDSVTWNLQIGSPSYFIRNITNGEAIGPTASTSAGVSADTRRITLDYGVNTVQGIANGVELVEISPNVTCLPGLFWHSGLGSPVCKAPPVVTIISPGTGTWIRSGESTTVSYSVTANYDVTCELRGGTTSPDHHDVPANTVAPYTYGVGPLEAAQTVRITCEADTLPSIPASRSSSDVRINVIPDFQET